MTNILIPTDFSTASLQLAEQTIQAFEPRQVNIILFHAFSMPSSAFELLIPDRKKPYHDLFNDQFRQACKQLKDQYPKVVQKICFKCMEGSTAALFRNFADANEIDLIVCPGHYQYTAIHPLSIDPRPLFKKSGIKVIREFAVRKTEPVYQSTHILNPALATAN